MIPDRDAPQRRAVGRNPRLNEREIRRAAAHVHHQHQPHVLQHVGQIVAMMRGEVIEGGLRLFDERKLFEAGLARGIHRQRARDFVERGGHGDHHFLLSHLRVRMRGIPRRGHV